ncbi:MAG: hypothetical protein IT369_03715 [Candidatus Latescibacteria bacterium]|nr:hypothetical protein [Candidatus Latescibacterota bacterium]
MSCELSHEDLIAYVHGEVEPARKGAIAAHLEACAVCRGSYEELQQTRRLLGAWPDEEPATKLVFLPQRSRFLAAGNRWRRLGRGLTMAAAASLVLLALGRSQIEYGQGQLRLQLSLHPADPAPAEAPLTRAEFEQGQRQLAELVQQAVQQVQAQQRQDLEQALQTSQTQQRRQLEQALTTFAEELDQQRQEDLQAVSQGLQVIDWSTADRFTRTEGLLQQLLIAAVDR